MKISVRHQYPENNEYSWYDSFKDLACKNITDIELSFYKPETFLNADIKDIISPFKNFPVKATSIHLAQCKSLDKQFIEVLNKTIEIANFLLVQNIVVHPVRLKEWQAQEFITKNITPILKEYNVKICWETFLSKRKFVNDIESICGFCSHEENKGYHFACYDTSHMHRNTDLVINDIKKYINWIKVFHISNWDEREQHSPIIWETGEINFYKILEYLQFIRYDGELVLEYLPKYHDLYGLDIVEIKKILGGI